MNVKELQKLQADPAAFRSALLIDADGQVARCAERLDDWQRTDFAALDPMLRRMVGHDITPKHQRAWLERPRGHSKTTDQAILVCWSLFACRRRRLAGVAAAADAEQSGLLRDAISKIVQLNPWLAKFLDVQRYVVRNLHTNSELRILSSDAATSYGLTPDLVICDELTHWKNRELWDSLISSAAKRANCVVVVITNAGFGESWQWNVRQAVVDSINTWYFHALNGPCASWITPERLAEQRRLIPGIAFARLWLNQWTSGSGDALADADINAAITSPANDPESGYSYVAGLDIGLSRDASALVIVGRHVGYTERRARTVRQRNRSSVMRSMIDAGLIDPTPNESDHELIVHEPSGRYRVASVNVWRPTPGRKVELEAVEQAIIDAHRKYNLACVGYDPWQAEYLAQRLTKLNIPTEAVQFVPQNLQSMAQSTLEAFNERLIDVPDNEALLADLRKLRIVEKSYGIRLDSPRGPSGHGDSATGLAVALHTAKRLAWHGTSTVQGELVCYPTAV